MTPPASTQVEIIEKVHDKVSTLRHWDIHPGRTVSLIASLVALLAASEDGREEDDFDRLRVTVPDQGAMFGALMLLPALEYLADQWFGAIGDDSVLRLGEETTRLHDVELGELTAGTFLFRVSGGPRRRGGLRPRYRIKSPAR